MLELTITSPCVPTSDQSRLKPHKVLTYVEDRAVYRVFQNIDPPQPFLHPASVSSPPHTRRAVRGSIFWKTRDIGLASYSIISLRATLCQSWLYFPVRDLGFSLRVDLTVCRLQAQSNELTRGPLTPRHVPWTTLATLILASWNSSLRLNWLAGRD
jgi:hypothetical protein